MKRTRWLAPLLVLAAVTIQAACTKSPDTERTSSTAPVLEFIEDDYEAALAAARARDLPLFIESWAPW
jgi:hypothetical protein